MENVSKSYKGRTVLNSISIYVEEGEIVGLLGPNGAGKTTTFKCLLGFVKPDNGRVMMNDEDITNLTVYERAKRVSLFATGVFYI